MPDASRERMLAKLAEWSTEESQRGRGALDAHLVHKRRAENVAVARVARFDPDRADDWVAELLVDVHHPYFFEHPNDHVPALLLIEAVRQVGVAGLHLLYEIPLDTAMVLDALAISFQAYAELDAPVFVAVNVEEKRHRGDRLTFIRACADFIQRERAIGRASLGVQLVWWAR